MNIKHNKKGGEMVVSSKELLNGGKYIVETILKTTVSLLDAYVPMLQQILLGEMADKTWEEAAPELIKAFRKDTELFKRVMTDPEMQAVIQELFKTFSVIIIQILSELQPQIDMITDRMWISIREVASRSAIGIADTVLNVVMSAIGEIPVAGGIIELVISILRGINRTLQAASPAIQFGITAFGTSFLTGVKLTEIISNGSTQIYNIVDKFTSVVDKISTIRDSINNLDTRSVGLVENKMNDMANMSVRSIGDKADRFVSDKADRFVSDKADRFVNNTISPRRTKIETAVGGKGKSKGRKRGKTNYKKTIKRTKKRIDKSLKRFYNIGI